MQLTRQQNWPEILAAEIKAANGRLFSWGEHDCCAFAARVVEAMTGHDFMGPPFAPYETEAEAQEILDEHGGVEGIATTCLGEAIKPSFAQRGDVMMIQTDHGPALGICTGAAAAFAAPRGIVLRPIQECTGAWRVQ